MVHHLRISALAQRGGIQAILAAIYAHGRRFNHLHGIMRTVYNQYDSMVRPLQKWLAEREVQFELNIRVTDLVPAEESRPAREWIASCTSAGAYSDEIKVGNRRLCHRHAGFHDGGLQSRLHGLRPRPQREDRWRTLGRCGKRSLPAGPSSGDLRPLPIEIDQSKWISFTATLRDPTFFRLVRDFTGNVPGEGGLITFADSAGWPRSCCHINRTLLGNPKT